MPLSPLSFDADYSNSNPVSEEKPTENWIDLLVQELQASGLSNTTPSLKQEIIKHIGPDSTFTFKQELQIALQQLFKRLTQASNNLTANRKAAIALKFQEGITACSAGFYNRIIVINQSFDTPTNLKGFLAKIRHNIVNRAAIRAIESTPNTTGFHVHIHNRFFLIASQHFGVQRIQETDPFLGNIPDTVIWEQISNALMTEYHSPVHLLSQLKDLLKSILEEHYFYLGRQNQGCHLPDTKKWADFLKMDYESCMLFHYPYTDNKGQAVLVHSSVSPLNQSFNELKAMLNHQNGLILFENTLFYTNFSAQEAHCIALFYEFSEEDDEEVLEIKNLFLTLPLDLDPNLLSLKSTFQLDKIRTQIGMQGMFATVVDLNWTQIINRFMNRLLEEEFLKPNLTAGEQFLFDLFNEQSPLRDMSNFNYLISEGFLRNINDFLLFLELCQHINSEKKAQCIQFFLDAAEDNQAYSFLLKLIGFTAKDTYISSLLQIHLNRYSEHPQKILAEINKVSGEQRLSFILELHDLAKKQPFFYPFFTQTMRIFFNPQETQSFKILINSLTSGYRVNSALTLLEYLEEDNKLYYLKYIQDYSNELTEEQFKNYYLESFIHALIRSTPAIQEKIFTRHTHYRNNIVISLFLYQPKTFHLIEPTLNIISNFKNTELRTVFTEVTSTGADIFEYLLTQSPQYLSILLKNFHSNPQLSKVELGNFLLLKRQTGETILEFFASLSDPDIHKELFYILSELPSPLRVACLQVSPPFPHEVSEDEFINFLHLFTTTLEAIEQPFEKALFLKDFNQCIPAFKEEDKKEYLNRAMQGLACIQNEFQELIINKVDKEGNNLLTNIIYNKPELLEQLLSIIRNCPNLDLFTLFSTQNNLTKNNALLEADNHESSRYFILPMIQLIKTLPYAAQTQILTQKDGKDKCLLEYTALSKDLNLLIEITSILCHPQFHELLVAWLSYLSTYRPIHFYAEVRCILFDCMEASLPELKDHPPVHTVRNLVSKRRIKNATTPPLYEVCNTFELMNEAWHEKMPLALKNSLFHQAIVSKSQFHINQLISYGAEEQYFYPTQSESSVLTVALKYEQVDVIKFLLKAFPHKLNELELENATRLLIQLDQQEMMLFILDTFKEKAPSACKNHLLNQAITNKNEEFSQRILRLGADANYNPTHDTNLLSLAIKNNLNSIAEQLLEMKLTPSNLELTLLNLSTYLSDNQPIYINKILQKYPHLNLNNRFHPDTGNSILHQVILNQFPLDLISLFCKAGADAHTENNIGVTALELALESQQFKAAQIMLAESSLLLSEKSLQSCTNTLLNAEQIPLLLALNKRYPSNLNYSLCSAIRLRKNELAEKLIDLGANANITYPYTKKNMLSLALDNNLCKTALMILGKGNLEANTLESTLFDLATETNSLHEFFMIKILLLQMPLNLNYKKNELTQNTTLHEAIITQKSIDTIEFLCQAGADLNQLNKADESALDIALKLESFDAAQVLIKFHKKPLKEKVLNKSIDLLAQTDSLNVMLSLFQRYPQGTSIAIKNKLLASALSYKNQELAEILLANGADANYYIPSNKETMLFLAIKNGLPKNINSLLNLTNSSDSINLTLLHLSADETSLHSAFLFKILSLHPKIDVNRGGFSETQHQILHNVIINHHPFEVIALLCQCGANVLTPNKQGKSAFDLMIETQQFNLLPIFLRHLSIKIVENTPTLIHSKMRIGCIRWAKFEYFLNSHYAENKAFISALINLQLSSTQLSLKSQELAHTHALACCNYLSTQPTDPISVNARKMFLNRILFVSINTDNEVLTEIRHFMRGKSIHYSQSFLGISTKETQSRVSFAYHLGLFGTPTQSFENLTKKEKKQITSLAMS